VSVERQHVTGTAVLSKATDERCAERMMLLRQHRNVPTDATWFGAGRHGWKDREGDPDGSADGKYSTNHDESLSS